MRMPWSRTFLHSLTFKLFACFFLIIVPLVSILVISNHYSVQVVRNQVAQSNQNLLSLYMGQIDRNLEDVDNYLFDLSERNTDMTTMNFPESDDDNNYLLARLRLFDTLNSALSYNDVVDLLFVYSKPNHDLIMAQDFGESYEEREQVRTEVIRMLEEQADEVDYAQWNIWQGNGTYYLFHLVKTGNAYAGAWFNIQRLMLPLKYIDLGNDGTALFATNELVPMSNASWLEKEGIKLALNPNTYSISGNADSYLMMGEASSRGDFFLVALVPDSAILEKLPNLQRLFWAISAAAAVFLLFFLFVMRRVFLLPVKRMIKAMRKLRDGNLDIRIPQVRTSLEFELMNDTFNRMIGEIRDLKIHVYEEQLSHQRAELKHLQLQIKPHFFLNSLNIVYNLATVQDYKLIQEMTKCLVAYFRFMFKSNSYFVPLHEELKHTANYLRIQELRFPGVLSYRVEAPDSLTEAGIPPLSIQTLVENAIQHAVNMDRPIEITVRVQTSEGTIVPSYDVHIEDTGEGFPEHVLQELQQQRWDGENGEHVGIWNVDRRLKLLYKGKAGLAFANIPGKGAGIRLTIPVHPPEQGES
ncbi:two-component system sensor histidine kinase YesM [Paenibacillus phyllosphaerae]|uniref:Two-component system sensor histidine kinase YesM n=1 Tax=Paenibacillus phyllosphaerae TaxID=274593 RepID=A0A7W5FMI7_9BACL|nr:histidine kinase [Paenibacillus phyllosphaerae]MBB3110112.1 two-component system sensor histidine kinase YesM [Paenibacillus phyllosphaerae]